MLRWLYGIFLDSTERYEVASKRDMENILMVLADVTILVG